MKVSALVFAVFYVLVRYVVGQEASPEKIAEMIAKLGSDSFQEREAATEGLWVIGQPAAAELRKAAQSDDPEAALRATEVLEKVELRITPDTPEEILGIIRRYQDADLEAKVDLLAELKSRRAYFQLLKLNSMEEDAETKIRLLPVIRGVGIAGARVAITQDDYKAAEELLKLSAMEPADMMALACLYGSMGLLEDGLDLPDAPANVPTELWKITLFRAKGDLDGAIRQASAVRRSQQLGGLKVLAGDPTLWLRQNGMGDRDMAALDLYVDLALKRWDGGEIKEGDLAPLVAVAKSQDSNDRTKALASLSALGHPRFAEEVLEDENPNFAFLHYLSSERIEEALAVIGIDSENPDYGQWVSKKFAELVAAEDMEGRRDEDPRRDLLLLAGFMESRGLDEDYRAAYSAPMRELAETRPDLFQDYLSVQFGGRLGAPGFAVVHASEWAGEDENRWAEVFRMAFGEQRWVAEWISWISEMEPEIKPEAKMRALMALFGIGGENGLLARKWIGAAWDDVEARPEKEREAFIRRILILAISRQDVGNALKARDMLDPEKRENTLWPDIDKYLSAADRWGDAGEILKNGSSGVSTSAEFHALSAATLRRAGLEEEAVMHDAWAEKLALGQASVCDRIGDHYIYGEDPGRAMVWYRRAALQADMSGDDFTNSLEAYAQAMLEAGNWNIAASCFEALVQVKLSRRFSEQDVQTYTKARLSADLAKALSLVAENRELAIRRLSALHELFATDGVLADDFFPMVRKAGLEKELEGWFEKSWVKLAAVIEKYPASHNTRNTAGWLAARACLNLDEAEQTMEAALKLNPDQAAYLDTMAEVQFAKGDRETAVQWSLKAIGFYPLTQPPSDVMIRKQHGRFKNAPLPLK